MFQTCKHEGKVRFIQQVNTVPEREAHVLGLIHFDCFIYPQGVF